MKTKLVTNPRTGKAIRINFYADEKVNESITSNAKFFTVICDRCGINKVIKCTSIEDAKEKLIEDGWDISSCNNCMCPQCCDEYNNELQQEENDYLILWLKIMTLNVAILSIKRV